MGSDRARSGRPATGRAGSASSRAGSASRVKSARPETAKSRPGTAASSRAGESTVDMNSQVCLHGENGGEQKRQKPLLKRIFQGNFYRLISIWISLL